MTDKPAAGNHDTGHPDRRQPVWWPILATHVCASAGPRGIIHAVAMKDALAARSNGGASAITVCGVGRALLAHPTSDPSGRDGLIVASWPPPLVDRCSDCAERLGTRNAAKGSAHWQRLIDTT